MISHFKEPIDIASSSFGESAAIFGGRENLKAGLENVTRQYDPQLIGVATTCLAETIGDDVGMFLREIRSDRKPDAPEMPPVVHVSTPSYTGTHVDGFHATVRALVDQLAEDGPAGDGVNVFSGMFSPADLRYLKEIFHDFGLATTLLPDYSETLDGPTWDEYHLIPNGGTSAASIRRAGSARASIEFADTNDANATGAALLQERFGVAKHRLGTPIGVARTDHLFRVLKELTGRDTPAKHVDERGRLIDSFVDGHKYLFGKRAVVYGDEDLVVGIVSLLLEIGVIPVLCASGGESGRLRATLESMTPELGQAVEVRQGVDFAKLGEMVAELRPDVLIGNSKGYTLSRELDIPLLRIGFPIHDRIGGARLLHIGYRGAQTLFDRITNTMIEAKQDDSDVGYTYM
jgi:nitrogenase molybdenum-iron protein NifN